MFTLLDVYKQIPEVKDNCCPICHNEAKVSYPTKVLFYDTKNLKAIIKHINLLVCTQCKIRFANKTVFGQYFSKKNDYRPIFFNPINTKTVCELINKASSTPILFKQHMKLNIENNNTISTSHYNDKTSTNKNTHTLLKNPVNLKASIKNIHITTFDKKCIVCNGNMADYVNIIPTSNTNYVKITGKYCSRCKMFFYRDLQHIEKILKNNEYAASYKINTDFYIEPTIRKNNIKVKSEVCCFYLKETETNISKKIIIVSDKTEAAKDFNVYHYSDIISRTLLAAIWKLNEKTVILNNKNHRILLSKTNTYQFFEDYIMKELNISKGGGLYSNFDNSEIVDVLLYSPYTNRYEIIKASYDKSFNFYYVDMSIFKRFIRKFGNPGIPIKVYNDSNFNEFANLKEESILHAFGYSVSKSDNLSDLQRQKIIADVLDLELMTTIEIVNLLEFLISSHNNIKYLSAKTKWERDLKFISNYKINPERFIIAKI